MKIFVSIVSYRDPLLKMTIESILDNKSPRHDVIVGVFEQTRLEDSLITLYPELCARNDIRYKRIDPEYSDGVSWARYINALQVEDEDFFYQIDSHMLFDKGWDRKLVNDWKVGQQKHQSDRIIITANCKNFEMVDGTPVKQLADSPLTCKVRYFFYNKECDVVAAHGDFIPATLDISPAIHICAGNFFVHTNWLREVGHNPNLFFEGEEQVMVLSSFAANYHMYHPRTIHCYHLLNTHGYITKQSVEPVIPEHRLGKMIYRSHQYLKRFISEFDEEILEKYREYSGLDYINQNIEDRARTNTIKVDE